MLPSFTKLRNILLHEKKDGCYDKIIYGSSLSYFAATWKGMALPEAKSKNQKEIISYICRILERYKYLKNEERVQAIDDIHGLLSESNTGSCLHLTDYATNRDINNLASIKKNLESEIQLLKQNKVELETYDEKFNTLVKQVKNLEGKKKKLTAETTRLSGECNEYQQKKDRLTKEEKSLELALKDKGKEIDKKKTSIDSLQDQIDELTEDANNCKLIKTQLEDSILKLKTRLSTKTNGSQTSPRKNSSSIKVPEFFGSSLAG